MYDRLASPGALTDEATLFRDAFDKVHSRLPALYRSFWHHAEVSCKGLLRLDVFSDRDQLVLRIERLPEGGYRSTGIAGQRASVFAAQAPSIPAALHAAGLF